MVCSVWQIVGQAFAEGGEDAWHRFLQLADFQLDLFASGFFREIAFQGFGRNAGEHQRNHAVIGTFLFDLFRQFNFVEYPVGIDGLRADDD